MAQNRSSAVMNQRKEPHQSLDDFPTPPWAGRALIEHVLWPLLGSDALVDKTLWEPACNRGYLVRALRPYFAKVFASDIFPYLEDAQGNGKQADFLFPFSFDAVTSGEDAHWIITNPPFRLAEQFISRALELPSSLGVAMLLRTSFLEGIGRYQQLFSENPPTVIAQFSERVPMVKGKVDPSASSATAYMWFVWVKGQAPQPPVWIPPCRARLEAEGDYA